MENLLVKFEVKGRAFEVYGTYEMCSNTDIELKEYHYPDFDDISAKEIVGDNSQDFNPSGTSWGGRHYDESDMIQSFLAAMIQNNTEYKSLFVEENLQKFIDEYRSDIVLNVNDLDIPRRILTNDMYSLYSLMLVTNEFIYYSYYEDMLMLSVKNHEIISDNYFAGVGYEESCENVNNGKEELLWRELPEE